MSPAAFIYSEKLVAEQPGASPTTVRELCAAEIERMFHCSPAHIRRTLRVLSSPEVGWLRLVKGSPELPASESASQSPALIAVGNFITKGDPLYSDEHSSN